MCGFNGGHQLQPSLAEYLACRSTCFSEGEASSSQLDILVQCLLRGIR